MFNSLLDEGVESKERNFEENSLESLCSYQKRKKYAIVELRHDIIAFFLILLDRREDLKKKKQRNQETLPSSGKGLRDLV